MIKLVRESPPSSWTAVAEGPTTMAMEDHTSGMFLQDEGRLRSPSFNLQSGQGSSSVGETFSDLPISGSRRRISDVDQQVGPDPLTVDETLIDIVSEFPSKISDVDSQVGPGLSAVGDNLMGLISKSPTRISDVEPQAGLGPPTVELEHISESPSICSSTDLEARQGHPTTVEISRDQVQGLSSPGWTCTSNFVIEAFDLFVDLLVLILEISQVMIINSTLLGWVVLGFNINSCLTKWTLLVWSTRGTSAPNGQNYIEPFAAIMQVIFSAASIIVKFPWRILLLQLLLSTAMVSSKVTMTCNRIIYYS